MDYKKNLMEISKSLEHIEKTGVYDVDKYTCSLLHLTNQLEYFYCDLVAKGNNDCDHTFYYIKNKPKVGQMAYFNIGRGFPKELMDGHWCYILSDLGYKALVIPSTSIKEDSKPCNKMYEMDIEIMYYNKKMKSRIQLSDIRTVDLQRLDLRKPFVDVLTDRDSIIEFVRNNLF